MMRFGHDKEVDALYIYVREIPAGGVACTMDLLEGVNHWLYGHDV